MLFLKNILFVINTLKGERYDIVHQNIKIYRTEGFLQNSSFLNNIFINNKLLNPHEESLIIKHESLHFRKLHSLDLLFVGFAKCFFWFNPVIHFFQKSLKEIHEYEVDDLMVKETDGKEYALLLLKLGVSENHTVLNQMSKKPLSKRIEFLFSGNTSQAKKYAYLAALPLLVFSLFAFTNEEVVKVYKETNGGKKITKIEVKSYPLIIKRERNYATWGFTKALKMPPSNLILNNLTTVNFNGYRYEVNPISLTESTVKDVNAEIQKRNLALVISEKELDINGNYKKIKLAIKHLKTGQSTAPEYFDMQKSRDQGRNGAFFVLEAYDRNFEKSQISYFFGSSSLLINKSNLPKKQHNSFNINSESSIISHSSDYISYTVYPDKLTRKAAEEAKGYFSKNGFNFELLDYSENPSGGLDKVKILFGKQTKSFDLSQMRHWVKQKGEADTKQSRLDESLVFEGNVKTKETKISTNNAWFKGVLMSNKYDIVTGSIEKQEINQKKEIRTVYETNFLGENPLVVINGEEFPSEILTRLNTKAFGWSLIYLPNNEKAITKYGEKAKDGYFEMRSINDYVFTNEKELSIAREIGKKHLNANKKRVLRINYKDAEGKEIEKIIIHKEDKTSTHLSLDVPKNSKILFMIDKNIVSENDIENTELKIIGGVCSEKIGEADITRFGAVLKGYDGYFNLTTTRF